MNAATVVDDNLFAGEGYVAERRRNVKNGGKFLRFCKGFGIYDPLQKSQAEGKEDGVGRADGQRKAARSRLAHFKDKGGQWLRGQPVKRFAA